MKTQQTLYRFYLTRPRMLSGDVAPTEIIAEKRAVNQRKRVAMSMNGAGGPMKKPTHRYVRLAR
jgi:hypothetical protein